MGDHVRTMDLAADDLSTSMRIVVSRVELPVWTAGSGPASLVPVRPAVVR